METLSNARIGITQHLVAPDPIVGLWCRGARLCFAADAAGALLASRDPTNTTSSWVPVIPAPNIPDDPRTILTVACPESLRCLALDSTGTLHAGPPPPGYAAIRAQLRRAALAAARGPARDHTITVRGPIAGQLSMALYRPRQRTVLALATASFSRPGARRLRFVLSPAGRRLVAHARTTVVTFEAVFAPVHPAGVPAGHPVHLWGRVTLRSR